MEPWSPGVGSPGSGHPVLLILLSALPLSTPSEIFPLEPLVPSSPCIQEGTAGPPGTPQCQSEGLVKPGTQTAHLQSFPDGDWPKQGGRGGFARREKPP